MLLLSNIATQLILANDPMKLNSETFENMVKLLIGIAVPVFSTLTSVVTVLYLDTKPPGYYMLRGTPTEDRTLVIVQASIFILIFCAFWTSRIWIQTVQGHERSNHILGSKAVALLCADLIAFFLASLFLFNYPAYQTYLYQIGPNVLFCKFTASIVVFHDSVRDHACRHMQPLRNLVTLLARRVVRRVGIRDLNSIEMASSL